MIAPLVAARALVKPTMPSVRPTAAAAITTTTPGRSRPRVGALSFTWVSFGEVCPPVLVHNLYRSAEPIGTMRQKSIKDLINPLPGPSSLPNDRRRRHAGFQVHDDPQLLR